ncbi:MAG: family 16 glycosylhydrolase, partial [Candidatus Brocadiia bacterium]
MTLPGYGYGYYETRMKVTSVPGVCDSFFWIEAPNYGPHEWDIEFLTNESWITSTNSGMVHLTINYPGGSTTYALNLPFNPSLAFHRYGFLWTPGTLAYTVDGQIAYTFTDPNLNTTAQGYIMMNTWTGNPYWGGGPPTQQATSVYDWVNFSPNVTVVPGNVQVTLTPAGAISAGAQWNVDSGGWQSSGATVTGLSPGTHDVYFNSVPGWASPVSTPITITAGATTSVTGTYTQLAGSLTVELNPAAAMAAGAQWNVGGAGQNSGANVGGLTVGSGYTVNYNSITNWASPAGTPVTISGNSATTAVANYLQTAGAPFMTLQPLPLATWQEWFGLWDSNIEGEYSWEMTPGVLATGFSDYGGLGENIDWQLAPVLTGFYYGYMASSDPHYVDLMVSCVDTLISLETIEPDGYPGWPASAPAGTSTDDLDWYYADSFLGDAAAFRPIVLMARQMITNPALKAAYGAKGQTYLALAETLYRKWVSRGGWRDTTYPGGMISVVLPEGMDPATGYKTWITNPSSDWADSPGQNSYTSANEYGPTWIAQGINNGMSHPTNKADEVALWLLAMWDATGNPEYQLRASKWFTYLKNYRMTLEDEWSSGLDGAGDLIWNYWEPAGSWDFVANQAQNDLYGDWGIGGTKTWYGLHPNNGYYWIDTQCIVAAFEHGVVFNESDITTLVHDAKTSWTPSAWPPNTQYYFNPSSLLPGMSVSAYPASGTVTQVAGCIPNSLTPAASSVWPSVVSWNGGSYSGTLNGTIVSATWNGSTGTIVVQPTGGGANVTLDTNTSTEVWLLRLWNNFVAYDTQIQQQFEANEDTNPATASSWGGVDDSYFLWLHSTLAVQSTPPTGVSIVSTLGEGYPTNYTIPGAECPTNINLQAPATDPAGFTFSQWSVNGTAQTAGLKSLSFAKTEPTTAVAQYVPNYTLTVQSTPPVGVSIGSTAGDAGTTNYTVLAILQGASVNLVAPATDPTGYAFTQWVVNGTPSSSKSITFAMTADTTAVAQYALNGYVLTVESTPPAGLGIGSSTGHSGTTDYTIPGIEPGTSVNLQAPAADAG